MRYQEYLPSPQCARVVETYWVLEGQATGSRDTIIPDGRIELVFHYGGEFWRHSAGAPDLRQPGSLLVGQMIAPVVLAPKGGAGVAAIRLRPAAARTWDQLSVDGDTSTNDTVLLLASGGAGAASVREGSREQRGGSPDSGSS